MQNLCCVRTRQQSSASLDYFVTSLPPYLHQFSTISGGNCIRHEAVANDTVFSDTPAVDRGVKQAQVFVARDTLVADAYPMTTRKQFVNTLEDNIRRRGAMDKLLSDSAKTEISNKVMDIHRAYHISNWHSEPYHQNQNRAEWRYRTI